MRNKIITLAKNECQGNADNEKYLSTLRKYLITKDQSFKDIHKKFD